MRSIRSLLPSLVLAALGCRAAGTPAPIALSELHLGDLHSSPITSPGYHNETSLAIDPTNAQRVISAWQVPATVGASDDGGEHWTLHPLPGVASWQLSGDPVVGFDADGHAFAMYIAFDRPADYDTLGRAAHRNAIMLNRSDDGGVTWRARPTSVIAQAEAPGIPFEDKPSFNIDRSTDPSRRGHIYAAWTEFRRHESSILFARSTDGGASFSAPVQIADHPGSPKDSVGADEGTSIVVSPADGTVYVVWSDSTGILVDHSGDGGVTFGRDVLIARTPDIVFDIPGVARANGYPSIALDPTSRRLYVAWVDARSGHPEPYIAWSDDDAQSWSAPHAVAPPDSLTRFFASLAVDPATGLVAIGYYRVAGPGRLEYVLASSVDRGAHFAEHTWSDRAFDPRGEFLGDYTGIDAFNGTAIAAWTVVERPDSATQPTGLHGDHHARVVIGRARWER